MSTSEVHASSASRWLQGLTAKGAPSQAGLQSSRLPAAARCDTASISAQAFQLNQAAGASTKTASLTGPSSGIRATHHHRHHGKNDQEGTTSSVNVPAKAGYSDVEGTPASTATASVDRSRSPVPPFDHHGGYIAQFPGKIADDLRDAYPQVNRSSTMEFSNGGARRINVTA